MSDGVCDVYSDAKANGVMVKMITGDHLLIAKETSRRLDLGKGRHLYVFISTFSNLMTSMTMGN